MLARLVESVIKIPGSTPNGRKYGTWYFLMCTILLMHASIRNLESRINCYNKTSNDQYSILFRYFLSLERFLEDDVFVAGREMYYHVLPYIVATESVNLLEQLDRALTCVDCRSHWMTESEVSVQLKKLLLYYSF